MAVLKAFLLTILLILIFSIIQIGFGFMLYETELIPAYLKQHIGLTTTVSFLISYLLMFKLFWKPRPKIKGIFKIKYSVLKFLPYLILIVFGLQLVDRPFWDLGRIWSYLNYAEFEVELSNFSGFGPAFYYSLFSTLIISPFFEELFFRKFLLQKLLEKNNQKISILISSLCFAVIHIETPYNLIPTFIFGIISSIIFIKTNKIGFSILLHFLTNLIIQTSFILNVTFDSWLLSLNFNLIYWIIFLLGIGITYFSTKKLLAKH